MLKQNPSVEMIVSETHLRRSYNVLRVHVQRLLNSTTKCHFRVNWPVSILSRFPSCAAYTHNMGTAYKTQLICRPSFRWLYFEPTWHAGFLNRYWAIHCNFNGPWIKVRKEAKIKKKNKNLLFICLHFFYFSGYLTHSLLVSAGRKMQVLLWLRCGEQGASAGTGGSFESAVPPMSLTTTSGLPLFITLTPQRSAGWPEVNLQPATCAPSWFSYVSAVC